MFILVVVAIQAVAATQLTVEEVSIPSGGNGRIDIHLSSDQQFTAFEMRIALPEGITYQSWEKNDARFSDHSIGVSCNSQGVVIVTCLSLNNTVMTGDSGWLLSILVGANPALEAGETLEGTIYGVEFATAAEDKVNPGDMTFDIGITAPTENRVILDETSTTMPEESGGVVDVRVKRAIKANEWSTIVLPFAMCAEQIAEAFGDEVVVGDFTSWYSEEDDDGNIVAIRVGFTRVEEMEANHPYLLRTSLTIDAAEGFTVDNVTMEEPEDEPTVQVGKKKAERGYFIGTYTANTLVPENDVFISGNKFWYSTGATRMKGFRGYFEFADVISAVEGAGNVSIAWDELSKVDDVTAGSNASGIYDLQGRKVQADEKGVQKLQKGIYIVNGKKVTR